MKTEIFIKLRLTTVIMLMCLFCAAEAYGSEYKTETCVSYHPEEVLKREGDYARKRCLLDVRWPTGVSNFATVVNFHGGGLVMGHRNEPLWPPQMKNRDPIAFVSAGYRLLTNATPSQAIGDVAAATAWTLKNISRYGGDPEKVFISGASAGGYLVAMVGMDRRWLEPHGFKPTDLAGVIPFTGQMTTHFNVRKIGLKDNDPRFLPKIDEWAPLHYASTNPLPPICFLTGGRDIEWKARVEENELLAASLRANGHKNCEFHETEGNHGGGVHPCRYFLRDFVMKNCDAGGVARFADGERVAFFGDSITHGGYWLAYLQLFWSTRHPGSDVRIMNCGVAGDTASRALPRLESDLLALDPDRVFVMFGMNDVGIAEYASLNPSNSMLKRRAERKEAYVASQRKIADFLAEKAVKTVFVTPTPYDQYSSNAKTNMVAANSVGLVSFSDEVRKLAAGRNLGLVELHRPLTDIFKTHKGETFSTDRVHPDAKCHMIMAALVLDAMSVNSLVARVSVNAKSGKVFRASDATHRDDNGKKLPDGFNAIVRGVSVRDDGIAFTYEPGSLPFPATAAYKEAQKIYPLTRKLNREIFIIEDLAPGTYEIMFNECKAGEFSAEEFGRGVNIALLDTPNQRKAMEVGKLADRLYKTSNAWRNEVIKARSQKNYTTRLSSELEDLYERLNSVRPAVSRVVVKRKKQ